MSKLDALRAMREANYAENAARARTAPGRPATRPPVAPPVAAQEKAEAAPAPAEGLCGHRNMSGRTCTREQGHTAKSHRYA